MVKTAQSVGRRNAPPPGKPQGGKPQNLPATRDKRTEVGAVGDMPEWMRQDAGRGTESIGKEDLESPRLKLIQALSPELQEYDDLRPGFFLHTGSEHIFDGPFRAVPIFVDKRYILWNPRESGGGILARADDGVHWTPSDASFDVKLDKKDGGAKVTWRTAKTVQQSGLAEWGSLNPDDPNSSPAATLMYNFLLGFPDFPDLMPAVLTFQRSSIRNGRRFLTKLRAGRAPIFGRLYEFSAVDDKNRIGQEFQNMQARGVGFVEDPETYRLYEEMNRGFTDAGLQIKDLESMQGETEQYEDNDEPAGRAEAEPARRGGKAGGGKNQRPGY